MACLILKNDGIGDLIFVSGIVAELSKLFGGELDLVTCCQNEEVARHLFGIRKSYFLSRDGMKYPKYLRKLGLRVSFVPKADKRIIEQVNRNKYEYVISLRRFIRASTLIFMSRLESGKHKYCFWQFPTNVDGEVAERCSQDWQRPDLGWAPISELSYFEKAVESVFGLSIKTQPVLDIGGYLTRKTISRRPLVGICISGASSKWPRKYWLELIGSLQSDGWKIVLIGGKKERKDARIIEHRCPGCVNMAGRASFSDTVGVLGTLSALIGNDTGFTHLAALVVPKVFVIYGGGTFGRFFPWPRTENQFVIYHGLDCFDCNWKCKYFFHRKKCIGLIEPLQVVRFFRDVMESDSSAMIRNLNSNDVKYNVGWRFPGNSCHRIYTREALEMQ